MAYDRLYERDDSYPITISSLESRLTHLADYANQRFGAQTDSVHFRATVRRGVRKKPLRVQLKYDDQIAHVRPGQDFQIYATFRINTFDVAYFNPIPADNPENALVAVYARERLHPRHPLIETYHLSSPAEWGQNIEWMRRGMSKLAKTVDRYMSFGDEDEAPALGKFRYK